MNEGDVDKRQVSLRVRIELVTKTVKNYGREEDGGKVSPAVIRALEEATRDVVLSDKEYEAIAAEVRANKRKRAEKRRHA
jgi:hypothetical protein